MAHWKPQDKGWANRHLCLYLQAHSPALSPVLHVSPCLTVGLGESWLYMCAQVSAHLHELELDHYHHSNQT